MTKKCIPVIIITLILMIAGCGQKGSISPSDNTGQQEDSGILGELTALLNGDERQNAQEEEHDLTFADFANAEVEPFESFVDIEQAILRQAAANGCQGRIWWYADSIEICAIVQMLNQYANTFSAVTFLPSGPIETSITPQGQDTQGNYVFVENLHNKPFTISADESLLTNSVQKTYRRTTAAHCNDVMTYAKRMELYANQKYRVFSEFYREIGKAIGFSGTDADRDMRVWTNNQMVYVLLYLPFIGNYAFAEYNGWNMTVANAGKQGMAADGSTTYQIVNNSLNLRTTVQISADEKTLRTSAGTYQRVNIRTATRVIDSQRDQQDMNTTPQRFDQMYQTWASQAASKMQYINNLNVKEVYKFSARSDLRDAQIKMREIRQRAIKIGYQMQPSPYEGLDPSYDPGQKYQQERDGVRYGQPKYRRGDPRELGE